MNDDQRVEVTELRVPYRDIDMNGLMRASAYVDHAETALAHFWRYRPPLEDEPVYVTSKLECRLYEPLRLDDALRLTVRIDKIGGKSIGFNIMIERGNSVVAEVELTRAATGVEAGEPVPLPEDTRDWLYGHLA
ncbi:acyl-CoA thioesterase [Agrobacterium sp. ES01]|uniref:acyl-CoA thioesterase n=1 Tax=Agrobacterium sp. ES01 TaxID=3420714 RepID=UPI003D0DA188